MCFRFCCGGGLTCIAIRIAGIAETLLAQRDPGKIVIDEIVGMSTTLLLLPARLPVFAAGFLLFRVLDILKPFPIRTVERKFNGGTAVVMDDIVAGILANLILRVALAIWS